MRHPRTSILLLLALTACAPADTREQDDAGGGVDDPAAGSLAYTDGPDLWLAALEYGGDGMPRLGPGRNITSRAGYDNQPKFLPDGSILYTRGVGDRTDIWRYDPATDSHAPVTETDDRSEYSPTPTPDGTGFSSIVVEPDSTQRLWRFDLDGSNGAPLFENIAPVGYHAWLDGGDIGMFVLGDPATLQVAPAGAAGPGEVVDEDVGRSLNSVPGVEAISYPVADTASRVLRRRISEDSVVTSTVAASGWEVRMLADVDGRWQTRSLAPTEAQDHAWTPDRYLLHGAGHRLVAMGPIAISDAPTGTDEPVAPPVVVGSLPDTALVISRLAVSPDGTSIVLVVDRPQN